MKHHHQTALFAAAAAGQNHLHQTEKGSVAADQTQAAPVFAALQTESWLEKQHQILKIKT